MSEPLTEELAITRAQRGAAFLDKRVPGWRDTILKSRLDMGSSAFNPNRDQGARYGACGCILAQVDASLKNGSAGYYSHGAEKVGIDVSNHSLVVRLGFFLSDGGTPAYRKLTEAWKKVLRGEA